MAGALMQQRQTIEIGVPARPPAGEILGLGVDHRQVMQKPQRTLVFARERIVALGEKVRREAELQPEAGEHLHAERPVGALEGEHYHYHTTMKPGNSFPVGQSFAMRGSVI